jgi:arylsulfatase A-like enzyme
MNRKSRCLLSSAILCSASPALAGDIAGHVRGPDGKPLAGARVVIQDVLRGDVARRDGGFELTNLPAGQHEISVSAMGLAGARHAVSVPGTGTVNVSISLQSSQALAKAAAMNSEPPAEHLVQKQAYLSSIRPVTGKALNIVVILFDDLGYGDLSSYGNRFIKTPNIDVLGKRGVKLTQFYSASPVCTPSRAALLTGRYPTRSHAANHVFFPTNSPVARIRRAAGYANEIPADEILLPEVLSRAGYATGAFGKWHLGDTVGHRPTDLGFQTHFGVLYSNDMSPLALYRGAQIETSPENVDQRTLTRRFTDEAVAFIRSNARRPFFAYVPYTAPHVPHSPHPDHEGVSEGGGYGDVVEDLDANVGRIARTLDELGLAQSTIVIVTSDNGADYGGSAGALRGRKGETFEGGVRVPAFVIWPGKTQAGTESGEMCMNIDLFPTLLGALGITPPDDRIIDGRDIAATLAKQAPSPHEYLYYVTSMSGEYQAVRSRDYKYHMVVAEKSPFNPTGASVPHAARSSLFRIDGDNESHDVSLRHPQAAKTLAEELERFRAESQRNPRGWF